MGCFPLHPSTTALLSSVELETTSNPRSVLGFVQKHLDKVSSQNVFDGHQVTVDTPRCPRRLFPGNVGREVVGRLQRRPQASWRPRHFDGSGIGSESDDAPGGG